MRYIKTYESFKKRPEIGDYIQVFLEGENDDPDDEFLQFVDFIRHNIGKVIFINNRYKDDNNARIEYDNIPNELCKYFDKNYDRPNTTYSKMFNLNNVDNYIIGKTPEEIEAKINANKYNL